MAYQWRKLINDPNDVVTEFIEGLVETYPSLRHLDGFPKVKVVLREDVSGATYDKVAVISGVDTLEASIAAVSKYGGASAGYCTILDALIPALAVLKENLEAGIDPLDAFVISSEAALDVAESTKQMQPQVECRFRKNPTQKPVGCS